MLFRERVLLAKTESTYGTDASPAATDAVLTSGLTITPYDGPIVSRNNNRSFVSSDTQINTAPSAQVAFSVELAGSGTAGTAPAWGDLLEACAFTETVDPGVDVEYQVKAPEDSSSVTLKFYNGDQEHQLLGARGNVTFTLARGQIPVMNFVFTGLYSTPSSQTMPTPDLTDYIAPIAVTNTNTPTFTVHGTAVIAESFSVDIANSVVHRNVIGADNVLITNRTSNGAMTIEAPDITSKNWFSSVESHSGITTGAVQLVHGTAAGNICTFDGPVVQLSSVTEADSDGLTVYNMNALWTMSSGNDEFKLTLT